MESGWFVVIGAVIGVVPTLVTGWMNQKAEKEKQLRLLAMQMALAEHRFHADIALNGGPDGVDAPLTYLAANYASVVAFMKASNTEEDIDQAYKRIAQLLKANHGSKKQHLDGKDDIFC